MRNFIVFCFCFIIIFSGCNKERKIQPVSNRQMQVLNYLPQETQLLIFMDLNQLRKTDFWESYFDNSLRDNKSNNWLYDFEKETGISFNKGISQFYTASAWSGKNSLGFWLDENLEKAKNYFKESDSFSKNSLNGKTFYNLNEKSLNFYFAGDSLLLVFNDEESLRKVLSQNHNSLKKNRNFIEVIENISNKNHYWMATDEGTYAVAVIEKIIGNYNDKPGKELIKSIKNLTLSAEFSEGVEIESNWGCSSSKNAFLLSSAIRSALAMNLLSDGDPVLQNALDKVEIDRNEKNINFHLILNENDIYQLRDFATKKNLDKKL